MKQQRVITNMGAMSRGGQLLLNAGLECRFFGWMYEDPGRALGCEIVSLIYPSLADGPGVLPVDISFI